MEELKWISNAIGIFAGIALFLSLVFHPVIATLNRKGYWKTVENNIFGSTLDFLGFASSVVMVVMSIIFYYM